VDRGRPELLSAIKLLADRHPTPGSFWLTGCQSFPLMKAVSESLSGRVAILSLLGFSAREADRRAINVPPFLPGGGTVKQRGASAAPTDLMSIYERIWRGGFPALSRVKCTIATCPTGPMSRRISSAMFATC